MKAVLHNTLNLAYLWTVMTLSPFAFGSKSKKFADRRDQFSNPWRASAGFTLLPFWARKMLSGPLVEGIYPARYHFRRTLLINPRLILACSQRSGPCTSLFWAKVCRREWNRKENENEENKKTYELLQDCPNGSLDVHKVFGMFDLFVCFAATVKSIYFLSPCNAERSCWRAAKDRKGYH